MTWSSFKISKSYSSNYITEVAGSRHSEGKNTQDTSSSSSEWTKSQTIITNGTVTSVSITETSSANSHPKYMFHWPQTFITITHVQNNALKSLFLKKNLSQYLHEFCIPIACMTWTGWLSQFRQNWQWQKVRRRLYLHLFITQWFFSTFPLTGSSIILCVQS